MTKNLQIIVNVIHSPYDDALGGDSTLHSKEEMIKIVVSEVAQRTNKIPDNYACSLVIGDKIEEQKKG